MKFPKGLNLKQKKYLKEVYEDAYKERRKETSSLKAKKYAKAKFYEEAFKIFLKKEKARTISEKWKIRNKKRKNLNLNESKNIDYKVYKVNGVKFIVSTDKDLLEKYKNAERKGLLRDMTDEFEQEVLFNAKEQYGISLDPDMFYVIKDE